MALVEIRQIEIRYGQETAVRGVDLDIQAECLTALVGPSGCGKTSLLRAIAGFETPVAGTITVDGEVMVGEGVWIPPEKRRIGMVFQQGALFPHMTVWQNVVYGLAGMDSAAEAARAALELVGMERWRDRYPDELSGGQQQRVALARALAPRPRLILLDEPFASLDAALRQHLRQELCSILEDARITSLMVTHDQEEALSVARRVVVMKDGQILQCGSPAEVYLRPVSLGAARIIGDAQLIAGEVCEGRAHTALGSVDCQAGDSKIDIEDGRVWVLVRPEDLVFNPPDSSTGGRGEVVRQHFFGHDLLDEVRLEDGSSLKVRVLSSDSVAPGEKVRVGLRARSLPIFPRTIDGDVFRQ